MNLWNTMLKYGGSKDRLTMLQEIGSKPNLNNTTNNKINQTPLSTEYYFKSKKRK